MAQRKWSKKQPRKRQFHYTKAENFDLLLPAWSVILTETRQPLGLIRREGPGNYEVRRPQDDGFHTPRGSRFEAACWLRDFLNDPADFTANPN
jgi:hypothetical protein